MKRRLCSLNYQQEKSWRQKKKVLFNFGGQKMFKIGMFVLTLVMCFAYVMQMNITATKGYDIRELEQKIASLQKENRVMELESIELQSFERIEEQLPQYYLVEAKPEGFVKTNNVVAVK